MPASRPAPALPLALACAILAAPAVAHAEAPEVHPEEFWPASPVVSTVIRNSGPEPRSARLPSDARGIVWASGSACVQSHFQLLRWTGQEWTEVPVEIVGSTGKDDLTFLRPADGWRPDEAYRVFAECITSSIHSWDRVHRSSAELWIGPASLRPVAMPTHVTERVVEDLEDLEEPAPDPAATPVFGERWLELCLGLLAVGFASVVRTPD